MTRLKNIKDIFQAVLGFIVSGYLLWLTIKKSGLSIDTIKLEGSQWLYFFGAIISFTITLSLQSLRIKLLWLKEKGEKTKITAYNSLIIGNFYNCLLPGNLGEGVRVLHFSRKNNVPISKALSTVITEKWIDALIFVPFSILLYTLKPFLNNYILIALYSFSGGIFILFCFYMVMQNSRRTERNVWIIILYAKRAGRFLFRIYWQTKTQLNYLYKSRNIYLYLTICMVFFCLNILQFYLLMLAADVNFPVKSVYTSFLIALSIMIIVIIPSAPSNIGVMHYGVYETLLLASRQFGIEPTDIELQHFALFSVYVHLSYFIPEILLGIIFLIKERNLLFKV